MEDTSDWLKKKIKPTESVIRSSGITSQEIPDTDVQESTEVVTPVIKKSESKDCFKSIEGSKRCLYSFRWWV